MSNNSSLLNRVVQTALAILFAAFVLRMAADLLLEVWQVLLSAGVVVLVGTCIWRGWVRRRSGW